MSNALTGKALKDRATELNVAGRSKMSADELRVEIARIEHDLAVQAAVSSVMNTGVQRVTPPLTEGQRQDNYLRQTPGRKTLSVAQQRQLRKMARRVA